MGLAAGAGSTSALNVYTEPSIPAGVKAEGFKWGVELAGMLPTIARHALPNDFRHIDTASARVMIVEGGPRLLPAFPEDLSAKGEALVRKLGVEVQKGTMVTAIDAEGVSFKQGDRQDHLPAKTVLWAGGGLATEFGMKVAARATAETDRNGKIKVMPNLTIPGFPNIFVTGDLALAYGARMPLAHLDYTPSFHGNAACAEEAAPVAARKF